MSTRERTQQISVSKITKKITNSPDDVMSMNH